MNYEDDPPPERKGLMLGIDDLTVGNYYAVVGMKHQDGPMLVSGQAWQCTAIQLPFVVGKLVFDPNLPPLTFDVRYMDFMKVNEDYVIAQTPIKFRKK